MVIHAGHIYAAQSHGSGVFDTYCKAIDSSFYSHLEGYRELQYVHKGTKGLSLNSYHQLDVLYQSFRGKKQQCSALICG